MLNIIELTKTMSHFFTADVIVIGTVTAVALAVACCVSRRMLDRRAINEANQRAALADAQAPDDRMLALNSLLGTLASIPPNSSNTPSETADTGRYITSRTMVHRVQGAATAGAVGRTETREVFTIRLR